MKKKCILCVFFLAILTLVACGRSPGAAGVSYESAECPFETFGARIDCGYLTVPEDRERPENGTVRLAVAILRSSSETPRPDPLIFLSGGPGGPTLQWIQYFRGPIAEVRQVRDVIFLDQRGTGFSEPSLECPELEAAVPQTFGADSDTESDRRRHIAALQACRERLVAEGVDLSAYHSAAIAADVHDLMSTLEVERYNLYGVSYGTRIAQTVMRDYPEEVRAAVLDGVVPIEENMFETFAVSNVRSLNLLFERCASDSACNDAFPDLETFFYALADELEKDPQPVTVNGVTYQIGDGELFEIVNTALFDLESRVEIPRRIHDLKDGQTTWVAQIVERIVDDPKTWSEGLHFSVWCADELPFNSLAGADAAQADIPPKTLERVGAGELHGFLSLCEMWEVPAAGPVETEPVHSAIPTLLLSGEYDPVTPPAFAERVAAHLDNAQSYLIQGHCHGVFLSSECAQAVTADFLDSPEDSAEHVCLERAAPSFRTR
jgi:pimeloyl-ACP methyl ester carboxylesterase